MQGMRVQGRDMGARVGGFFGFQGRERVAGEKKEVLGEDSSKKSNGSRGHGMCVREWRNEERQKSFFFESSFLLIARSMKDEGWKL